MFQQQKHQLGMKMLLLLSAHIAGAPQEQATCLITLKKLQTKNTDMDQVQVVAVSKTS